MHMANKQVTPSSVFKSADFATVFRQTESATCSWQGSDGVIAEYGSITIADPLALAARIGSVPADQVVDGYHGRKNTVTKSRP
jgi:hypothetical protein